MMELRTPTRGRAVQIAARYWLPLLAWMGIIFYLSSCPSLPGPPEPWINLLLKKGGHFCVYGVLAFLWWRVLSRGRPRAWTPLLGALVLTTLYAISDEYHQSFVPGRQPRVVDVVIDASGAAIVLGIVCLRERRTG
jgi:VanZ family protein